MTKVAGLSHKHYVGDWAKSNLETWKVLFCSYPEGPAYKGPNEVYFCLKHDADKYLRYSRRFTYFLMRPARSLDPIPTELSQLLLTRIMCF
jgi:hypothetical protein